MSDARASFSQTGIQRDLGAKVRARDGESSEISSHKHTMHAREVQVKGTTFPLNPRRAFLLMKAVQNRLPHLSKGKQAVCPGAGAVFARRGG